MKGNSIKRFYDKNSAGDFEEDFEKYSAEDLNKRELELKKKSQKKFKSQFTHASFYKGSRKQDSNYYKRKAKDKKIAYISHLLQNTSQLAIVSSIVYPELKTGLIDRFLVMAIREQVKPFIIITKTDIEQKYNNSDYSSKKIVHIYRDIGYPIVAIDNKKNLAKEKLVKWFKGEMTAIIGHSGVGKTTMLTGIDPSYVAATQEISSFTKRGRHTTTVIKMHDLQFGGAVYDMPGLKEVDFVGINKKDLNYYYPDFHQASTQCHFSDCVHLKEKNCGVKEALARREIHELRYKNYLSILADLPDY